MPATASTSSPACRASTAPRCTASTRSSTSTSTMTTLPVEVVAARIHAARAARCRRLGHPGGRAALPVHNPGAVRVQVTVVGSVSHTAGRGDGPFGMRAAQTVRWRDDGRVRGLDFGIDLPDDDVGYGTLSLTTTDASTTAKPQWVTSYLARRRTAVLERPHRRRAARARASADPRGPPARAVRRARRRRGAAFGRWARRADERGGAVRQAPAPAHRIARHRPRPRAGRGARLRVRAGLELPQPHPRLAGAHRLRRPQRRSRSCATTTRRSGPTPGRPRSHLHRHLPELEASTTAFVDALYGGTLDPVIADAVGANVAAARSTTCFVVESPTPELGDGPVFAAWEGSFDHGGSCEGTCTHVWSYAQTVAWLFPSLERSARRVEFLLETDACRSPEVPRATGVFGGPSWFMAPAVDGQLGTLLRLHREWRFSGDDEFLAELWPAAARSLDHAIREWDHDGDGLLDGELHNTYDIEFHGIEPLANGMFIAALRAGARMAEHFGEVDRAVDWAARADRAAERMDALLWNGEYYRQVVDDRRRPPLPVRRRRALRPAARAVPCVPRRASDTCCRRSTCAAALGAIFAHNYRDDLSAHESTQRVYALNDEGGLLLASWPNGGRPAIPFVYSDEVWTGIEHQVATSLVYAGRVDEALVIERTLRARYDGTHAQPVERDRVRQPLRPLARLMGPAARDERSAMGCPDAHALVRPRADRPGRSARRRLQLARDDGHRLGTRRARRRHPDPARRRRQLRPRRARASGRTRGPRHPSLRRSIDHRDHSPAPARNVEPTCNTQPGGIMTQTATTRYALPRPAARPEAEPNTAYLIASRRPARVGELGRLADAGRDGGGCHGSARRPRLARGAGQRRRPGDRPRLHLEPAHGTRGLQVDPGRRAAHRRRGGVAVLAPRARRPAHAPRARSSPSRTSRATGRDSWACWASTPA